MYLDSWQSLKIFEGCCDYLVRDLSHSFRSRERVVRLPTSQSRGVGPIGISLSVPISPPVRGRPFDFHDRLKPGNLSEALLNPAKGPYKPARALLSTSPSITVLNYSQDHLNYASVVNTPLKCIEQMRDDHWHAHSRSLPVQQSEKIHDASYGDFRMIYF